MASADECRCCQEIYAVREELARVEEKTGIKVKCVTLHPGFEPACLNVYTLETVWHQFKDQYNEPYEGPTHKKNRHIAYRQLVRLVWKHLGKHIRVRIPSCAMEMNAKFLNCIFMPL